MRELKYNEIEEYLSINPRAEMVFEEYDNNNCLLLRMEQVEVFTFIKENEFLAPEDVETYYGEYMISECYHPYIRLILTNTIPIGAINDVTESKYYPIHLNKIFMDNGLQKVLVKE